MENAHKKDWRIGITWEVLVLAMYAIGSTLEIFYSPTATNLVAILLLLGLVYYVLNLYRVQRFQIKGVQAKNYLWVGIVVLVIFGLFSLGNMFLMITGELGVDVSYFNLMVIWALFTSLQKVKKLSKEDESNP